MKWILTIAKFIWKNKAWTIPAIQQGYKFAKPYVIKGYEKVKRLFTKNKPLSNTEIIKPEAPESIDK